MKTISRKQFYERIEQFWQATASIRQARVTLRNVFLPTIRLYKDGRIEHIYPDKFYKLDLELEKMQDEIFDCFFKDLQAVDINKKGKSYEQIVNNSLIKIRN